MPADGIAVIADMSPILYIYLKLGKLFVVYIFEKGVIGSIDFVFQKIEKNRKSIIRRT